MKIVTKESKRYKALVDIKAGETFSIKNNDELFIRTSEVILSGSSVSAVSLEDGKLVILKADTPVFPVEAIVEVV